MIFIKQLLKPAPMAKKAVLLAVVPALARSRLLLHCPHHAACDVPRARARGAVSVREGQ